MTPTNYSIFESELQVRPDDIDMFNHVHNSKYLDYVLAARYEQMHKFYKMSWEDFAKMGYGWVVSKVTISFKRPLKLGNTIIVKTSILSILEKGCTVQFEIVNKATGKVASDGVFDYSLIDLATQKSCRVTPQMVDAYCI